MLFLIYTFSVYFVVFKMSRVIFSLTSFLLNEGVIHELGKKFKYYTGYTIKISPLISLSQPGCLKELKVSFNLV
jgi:hypothetical protein